MEPYTEYRKSVLKIQAIVEAVELTATYETHATILEDLQRKTKDLYSIYT